MLSFKWMPRLIDNNQYIYYIKTINCLIQVIDKKHYLKNTHVSFHNNPHYFWDITKQTLRWYYRYLEVLTDLLDTPIKKKYRQLEMLLIIGLVRIDCLNEANHHVVKHSVDLTRALNMSWSAALVNKVLRKYIRENDRYKALYTNKQSLMMAHPGWLIRAIKNDWPQKWHEVVLSNQCIPTKWLNVTSSNQRIGYQKKYSDQVSTTEMVDTALKVLSSVT